MAAVAASMLVGPLVAMVKEKASSFLLDQYKVMEGMEQQHNILQLKLPAILDVITDAEQAASQRAGVKVWLAKLKTVAYQANEVFDEFKYEALRRQAKKRGHYSELGFDVVKLFPTHNRFVFRNKMGKKLRGIVQAIEVLVAQMNDFGFKCQQQAPASKQWRETDHVIFDPKKMISRSRDQDTKEIVHKLLGQASNADLMVVPIVGIGGLGKTTLAQLVYNEPEIQKHFELLLWVCVSDSFDVDSLAKSIAELAPKKDDTKATSKKDDTKATSKQSPQDSLQNAVSGHRYLLVLDDVWNRDANKWVKLKARLQHGGVGSAVLTTTRDQGVANIMGTVEPYKLNRLGDEFVKEIIETRAFGSQKEDERPDALVKMVGGIVKRCAGSPLAATALGSVLRTKTSEEEWKAISSSSSICTEESGILPILKLSYDDLPSQMKQCFGFCAVFPKDYEIDVEKLIQLWIAHGFIQDQKEVRPETIAKQIFHELASRSFFQDVKQVRVEEIQRIGGYYCRNVCKIHDLMHDVALSIMEKECALATDQPSQIKGDITTEEPSQIEWLTGTARHLFLSCQNPGNILDNSLAKRSPAIKTLLCDSYMGSSLQHLSQYSSLQALRTKIGELFPLNPKHLHHLRYLDLSGSNIEALPEDISSLYNLQTLDLSGCKSLRALPRKMKYMTALRHIYTHGCPELKSMPPGLRKLTSLQTLTYFVAGTGSGVSNVGELKRLNLGSQFELCQIENVTEEDAKEANLRKKKELRELTLKWTFGYEDDAKVLEQLEPHDGLQAIRIKSYGGTTFPTWMAMLRNMVEIHIFHCGNLQCLFKSDTSFTFPNLKELGLQGLQCLEIWWEINNGGHGEEIMFPQLEKLSIIDCGKLTALPEATLISESYGTMVWSAFPALKVLNLENLESFQRLEAVKGTQGEHIMFPQLEELSIGNCPVLVALPEAPFPALKILKLKWLMSLQRWDAVEGTQRQEIMFPQLEKLFIIGCGKLTALPGEPTFPKLENVLIEECPMLKTPAKAPKFNVLQMEGCEEEMFSWIARHMTSLTNLKLESNDSETTWAAAEHSLREVVDGKEKWNHDLPLAVMELHGLKSGVTELCACFVQLQDLEISRCDALIHWPEREFQNLVSLTRLYISCCKKLTGYAEAPPEPSTSSEMSPLLPSLESLAIWECDSLVEVFNVPTSLRRMNIGDCRKLESISGRRLQQGKSASSILEGSSVSEVSSSAARARPEHFLLPCLEYLRIDGCDSLSGALDLPPSLKELVIESCDGLRSLEFHSGELPSLERLTLGGCETLSSLPDGPQAYSSLRFLRIRECPGIKKLPTCLQQRLGSLKEKILDARYEEGARYEGPKPRLLKPKTTWD